MKKKIAAALAATFALGVTSAFAANPFTDVPAKHWAYESVSKLQKAGIVEGYSNGQFGGEKSMTRYEMAIVVAKAMTKLEKADAEQKASINKLAAEFGAELKNLGVRVETLEKNASSIKFTGEARLRYKTNENADASTGLNKNSNNKFANRLRIYMNGNVGEDIVFAGRLVAEPATYTTKTSATSDSTAIDYANFTYKGAFGGAFDMSAGRFDLALGYGLLSGTSGGYDAVKFAFGGKEVKAWVAVGDNTYKADNASAKVTTAEVTWTASPNLETKLSAYYSNNADYAYKVYSLGAKYKFATDWTVYAAYSTNQDAADGADKNAYFGQLQYKGANKSVAKSWGLFAQYWKAGAASVEHRLSSLPIFEALTGDEFIRTNGIKSWGYGANYTFAKNAVFTLTYQSLKSYDGSKTRDNYLYARSEFYF